MKKIILVLLISLTALLADYVIKKDGTLTKVVDPSTIPEPNMPVNWPWKGFQVPGMSSHLNTKYLLPPPNDDPIRTLVKTAYDAGANTFRLNMVMGKKQTSASIAEEDRVIQEAIDTTERYLLELKKYGMTAILGLEISPYSKPECKDATQTIGWWDDGPESNHCLDSIRKVARRLVDTFHDRGSEVAAYQFISEPREQFTASTAGLPHTWGILQKELLAIVREKDPKRYFMYSATRGGNYASYGNNDVTYINDPYIVYNFHSFQAWDYVYQGIEGKNFPINYTLDTNWFIDAFQPVDDFVKKHDIKYVVMGSFGLVNWAKDGYKWVRDNIEAAQRKNYGWLYWSMGEPHYTFDPRVTVTKDLLTGELTTKYQESAIMLELKNGFNQ